MFDNWANKGLHILLLKSSVDIDGSLETEPSVSNQSNIFCIAGDDMFATFSMISNNSPMIHGFSRIYLYSFIMLFTYVILSLFIAIIMDT